MKSNLLALLILTTANVVYSQSMDTIKIKLVSGKDILPGASLTIKDTHPPGGTVIDENGIATLIIPTDKKFVEISIIGPYIRLKIERPTDSIYFDIKSKNATFYNNRKKLRTKKQIVRDY